MGFLDRRAPTRDTADDDEYALVAAARHERRAFAPLYARYANPVFQYCYGRLGSREEAEDVTSLVFSKALDALPRYQDGSFRSWLFAIAHNAVIDHVRAKRHDTSLDAALDVEAAGPSPDEIAADVEAYRRLREVMAHLSDEQRQVIELRLNGLNGPEIARVLGRSHAWVRVNQYRAATRLRLLLRTEAAAKEAPHGAA
jgi:RNA polymerase sigma-70 factor (ECF subfamily)